DLERDAGIGERERLLAAAPEQKRVTALEAYDAGPLAAERDEHRVHLVLCEAVALDSQCVRRCLVDELGRDEPVIDEHVACTQGRTRRSSRASCSCSKPTCDAKRSRSHCASAGDAPAVDTATVMSPRRCRAGRMKVHSSGTSSTLQKIRRALASAKTRSPCSTS